MTKRMESLWDASQENKEFMADVKATCQLREEDEYENYRRDFACVYVGWLLGKYGPIHWKGHVNDRGY